MCATEYSIRCVGQHLDPSPTLNFVGSQLIRVAADGTVSEISPAEAAAAAAAAADSRSSGPLFDVPTKVMKSVQAALEKQEAAYQAMLAAAGGPPAVGTQCKRKNCKNRYEGEESNDVECTFCPGEPVFHEG